MSEHGDSTGETTGDQGAAESLGEVPGPIAGHISGEVAAEAYHQAYQTALSDAVAALTKAARLARPALRPYPRAVEGEAARESVLESVVVDESVRPRQSDWAEFVTLALAGAAANVGGVEAILAGRPGSWEAEEVRRLLESTVGADEAGLWEHRTEPLMVTLYVDELLSERTEAGSHYIASQDQLDLRSEATLAPLEEAMQAGYRRHAWEYRRTQVRKTLSDGPSVGTDSAADADGEALVVEMVAVEAAAPAWSWEEWRRAASAAGAGADLVEVLEDSLRTGQGLFTGREGDAGTAYIPKSPEDAAELARLEDALESAAQDFADLDGRLEDQRQREWAEYGAGVAERIEAAARTVPGLTVPVQVVVDVETYRRGVVRGPVEDWTSLENRLIDTAIMDTPTPADYEGTPLHRLLATLRRPASSLGIDDA